MTLVLFYKPNTNYYQRLLRMSTQINTINTLNT